MKKTEEQIRKERDALSAQLYKLERARRCAENKGLVGKCFRYRNSYSGKGPGWWLYSKITGVDKSGSPESIQFEHTENGEFQVKRKNSFGWIGGWTEITPAEFSRAWKRFLKILVKLK